MSLVGNRLVWAGYHHVRSDLTLILKFASQLLNVTGHYHYYFLLFLLISYCDLYLSLFVVTVLLKVTMNVAYFVSTLRPT